MRKDGVFRRLRRWPKFVLPPVILFAVLGLYGFWYEPSSLRAVEYAIALDDWERVTPAPLRIAVISDLHGGAPYVGEGKIDAAVQLANEAKPDLILLTGDYVTKGVMGGTEMPPETIAAHLKNLSAPLGAFAVLGNHDRSVDAGRIAKAFEHAGIPVLDDRNVTLKRNGKTLHLAGISDFRSAPHDVPAALDGLPAEARAVCFTHSPDVFPLLPSACALTVAGHTHGGQVRLPFFGRPVVPSRYRQRYAAGFVREGGKALFVSTGIGTSIVPVRFGVPPEVSILQIAGRR